MPKTLALSSMLFCCTCFAAFCQNRQPASVQANIIDTSARAAAFAPGVVSTPFEEGVATFMPDGNTVYFYQGTINTTICSSKKVNGKWARPKVLPFSGRWNDWDPFLAPDGKRMFFVSNRPLPAGTPQSQAAKKSHLWYADHLQGDGWSAPHPLDAPFNFDDANNYAPTVSRAGTLFFYSPQRDKNKTTSYYAKWLGSCYDNLKELTLNGTDEASDPFIAPDESYIIFVSGNDLYISLRQGDGWAAGQKLGPQVNNGDSNFDPTVSPDGKTLYYSSTRVKGFYQRDEKGAALDYDKLQTEMQSIFNGRANILMIPINLPKTTH